MKSLQNSLYSVIGPIKGKKKTNNNMEGILRRQNGLGLEHVTKFKRKPTNTKTTAKYIFQAVAKRGQMQRIQLKGHSGTTAPK